jgi:alkylation response protein AidB-like acyl-CoA dehydrogenase
VDVRLSAEQVALRDSVVQVVGHLGPHTVAELGDAERGAKLDAAVAASGWRELRAAADGGAPWASAVEVAIVAEELGRGLADAAFLGPTLASDLRRAVGAPAVDGETVAFAADLSRPAEPTALTEPTGRVLEAGAVAIDAQGATAALALVPNAHGVTLASVPAGEPGTDVDLTRPVWRWSRSPAPVEVAGQTRVLSADDRDRWTSLALAVTSADLVGVMRGALDLACDYARQRHQYGVAIGSFQAVQHLLADALVATEGSHSIALHAAWAIDALPGAEALTAASAAKAYCARAARMVCETAIQVHGGIGNTWECLAHVYLRRALHSTEVLGGVGPNLARVLSAEGLGGGGFGGTDGLR